MKKVMSMLALALFAMTLTAGALYKEIQVTVTNGGTSASGIIDIGTLNTQFGEVDRIVSYNSSGLGTGVVTCAVYDFGVETDVLSTSTNLPVGCAYNTRPITTEQYGALTNIIRYSFKRLRVSVAQNATNTPTIYKCGVFAK